MTPGEPRVDGTSWRCPCGKPMACQYVVTHECTVWRCANGHRWGQLFDMRVPDAPDPEYLVALHERCMKRVGYDPVKAERLVDAVIRGWTEADTNWRERAA